MSKDAGVDPRFPAVFQRGYDGGAEGRPAREARAESVGMPPAPAVGAPRQATGGEVAPAASVDPAEAHVAEPRANPYLIVVWVLSIALVIGGAWAGVWSQRLMFEGFAGPDPTDRYVLAQVFYFLSAPLVQLGGMGVFGMLFWHAAVWRRRAIAERQHPQHR